MQNSCDTNRNSILQTMWKYFPLTVSLQTSLQLNLKPESQLHFLSFSTADFAEVHIHYLTRFKHLLQFFCDGLKQLYRFGDTLDSEHLLTLHCAVWVQAAAFLTRWLKSINLPHLQPLPGWQRRPPAKPNSTKNSRIQPLLSQLTLPALDWQQCPNDRFDQNGVILLHLNQG